MEDFKQYLSDQADDAERQALEQVQAGLNDLRVEATVHAAAIARKKILRRIFWQRVAGLVAITSLLGLGYYFFNRQRNEWLKPGLTQPVGVPPVDTIFGAPPYQSVKKETPVPAVDPSDQPKQKPMAAHSAGLPTSRFPAPNVRGENASDPALKALVDQVWYTAYPLTGVSIEPDLKPVDEMLKSREFDRAYIQIQKLERNQQSSATLQFLKGYCLLELGEGSEALRCFEKLEENNPAWEPQLEWYRALGYLLSGDREQARTLFSLIADQKNHLYHQKAAQALLILK